MNQEYIKKLLELADEVKLWSEKPGIGGDGERIRIMFVAKLNQLLGYIEALRKS